MSLHQSIIASTSPEIGVQAWHKAPVARAILAEMLDSPPAMVERFIDDILSGEPVRQYDRTDPRVARLEGFAMCHFDMTGTFELTVDEAIGEALAARRAQVAERDRLSAYMQEGFNYGEARRMASVLSGEDLPDVELRS